MNAKKQTRKGGAAREKKARSSSGPPVRGKNGAAKKYGPRFIAIAALCEQARRGEPAERIVEESLQKLPPADRRDTQLAAALIYGVLRWQGYLDAVISEYAAHPLSKMKCRTLQALRIGAYQLLFMDRVPDSAAINETVQAVKDAGQPKWLTGFINGVLRNIARDREALPDPRKMDEKRFPLAALLSHPQWLLGRWEKRYGRERAIRICQANNALPPLTLRVNTKKTTRAQLKEDLDRHGLACANGLFASTAVMLDGYKGLIADIPGFVEGYFQVQDEAAQLVTELSGPFGDGKYLDGCAGLGGKTSHLAQLLPDGGRVVAVEPNTRRARLLKENLARLGLSAKVTVRQGTLAETDLGDGAPFRAILIDAPCSGSGVIRRHPDIRWSRSEDDLLRYQAKQLSLLHAAAGLLLPGGVLVYATCSIEPEENDQVISRFLTAHPEFALTDCREILSENCAPLVDAKGFFRTLPGDHGMDGFFAARLKKKPGTQRRKDTEIAGA